MLSVAAGAVSVNTKTGTFNGSTWTAESRVIGQTSTATIVGGGDPIYLAAMPKYSGVVALIMNYGTAGSFICSGSLLSDRQSVLTAGHCASDGKGNSPISTTAYFYGGPNPDTVVFTSKDSTAVQVANLFVNPKYTGEVIDQNDTAVYRLTTKAPDFATSYDLFTGTDLTGLGYNIAGYGGRSDTGGSVGVNLGVGRLRQGDNRYDFALGDPDFAGFFNGFFGKADVTYSFVSDFDNGLAANDASCVLASSFGLSGSKYCNLGVGAREVSSAGGDSGGPQFIDGKIASVTSYGLSFGMQFGDIDAKLNSSFGEFNGFAPVFANLDFINSVVPEPATWAMMIVGFGMVGAVARRRRPGFAAA